MGCVPSSVTLSGCIVDASASQLLPVSSRPLPPSYYSIPESNYQSTREVESVAVREAVAPGSGRDPRVAKGILFLTLIGVGVYAARRAKRRRVAEKSGG